jgi:hypothetical protein
MPSQTEVPVAKFFQDACLPKVPTSPGKRRITIHVFRLALCPGVEEHLNRIFGRKSRGPMQRRLASVSRVAHKALCHHAGFCHGFRVRSPTKQDFDYAFVVCASLARRRMERCFSVLLSGVNIFPNIHEEPA